MITFFTLRQRHVVHPLPSGEKLPLDRLQAAGKADGRAAAAGDDFDDAPAG